MIVSLMSLHLMVAAAAAPAVQEPSPVPAPVVAEGTRVRVTAGDKRWVGRLVESGDGTVSVLPDKGPLVRLRLADVSRLEVSRGRMKMGDAAMRGGSIGLLIGAAGGVLWGVSVSGGGSPNCLVLCNTGENAAVGGLIFGGLGGALGAFVGAGTSPEKWGRVEHVRTSVVVLPQRRGVGAALRLGF